MPMRPRSGSALARCARGNRDRAPPSLGCLNECTSTALRIDAGHHVLDRAVLAGGVHRLQHDQHRPAVVGVERLLRFDSRSTPSASIALASALLDIEPAASRPGRGRPAGISPACRPKAFDEAGELHAGQPNLPKVCANVCACVGPSSRKRGRQSCPPRHAVQRRPRRGYFIPIFLLAASTYLLV